MNAFILTAALSAALHAPPAVTEDDPGWKGTSELGLAISKGNTDSETLVGRINLKRDDSVWRRVIGASFLYGKNNGLENAYRYEYFGDSGYRMTERTYAFGSMRNERDHFAANEYQWTVSAGYGYEAIKNETTNLTVEGGPGYRWAKLQGLRVHNNETVVRGTIDFNHQVTETTSVYDTLLIEAGADNTFARNNLGLKVKMTEALALKAGLEARHNTDVQPGTKRTDTLTTVNVAYDF